MTNRTQDLQLERTTNKEVISIYLSLIHYIQRTIRRGVIAAAAIAALATAHAQVPDRDWPSVVVSPILDVPMRDTAITRGPDPAGGGAGGMYYLTGTLGPDFENSRFIKLWKSRDLKTWSEIGVIWDQDVEVFGPKGDRTHEKTRWMRQSHKDPASADSPVVHGLKSPELHYIKGNWYICFSINDQGTGLLKSSSGQPEGPYEAHAQITLRHGDPSMFADDDGSVYWLFGGGWIAKMNDDLTAIVEQPRLLATRHEQPPDWAVAKGTKIYRDHPLTVGTHGVFLFKHRGRYYLTAAERTNRLNAGCDDTFVAWSDTLMGPYSEAYLMIPHGGGVTVFRGPRSSAVPDYYYPQQAYYLQSIAASAKPVAEIEKAKGDDPLYATFFGNDPRAVLRDRPAFVPLEWSNIGRPYDNLFGVRESTPVKPKCVITERGPWRWMKPLLPADEVVRDIMVTPAPDGQYYFSGAAISHPGKLMIWKSSDLARWQALDPPVWRYENIEWLEKKLPYLDPGKCDWNHIFWHSFITWHNNTFYITFNIFGNDTPGLRGAGALKSTTGKIEGPYQSLGRVGGQVGKDPGPNLFFFSRWQGKLYAWDWINFKNVVACADLDAPGWKWDWKRVDGGIYEHMHRGDCSMVHIWDDVPVFLFHSSGKLDLKERSLHTYDVNYLPMATPWGPPRGQPRTIPHIASGNVFQDHKGYWWASYFGSDHSGPWWCRFGLVPLRFEKPGNGDLVVDVENEPDTYQKTIMGGGNIAEVKTVLESLDFTSLPLGGPMPTPSSLLEGKEPSKAMLKASCIEPETRNIWNQGNEMKAMNGACDILFVGDSLTAGWSADRRKQYFGPWKTYGAGIGGETTQGILDRLQQWPDALRPRVIVFMIGANNVAYHTHEIAAGTIACVRGFEKKWPDAKIILVGMPPRALNPEDPLCKNVVAVNAITCKIADNRKVFYLSLHESFKYRGDNKGFEGVGKDTLHLAPEGYVLWAKALEPLVTWLLGEPAKE